MAASQGPIINFFDDSTGSVERFQNNKSEGIMNFKYDMKNDTIFERTRARNWKIIKLTNDSLVIFWENVTARYYRLP